MPPYDVVYSRRFDRDLSAILRYLRTEASDLAAEKIRDRVNVSFTLKETSSASFTGLSFKAPCHDWPTAFRRTKDNGFLQFCKGCANFPSFGFM